jgi:hypothetical protein
VFPTIEPTTRHPLFSAGFRRACSPGSTILWDAPTPVRPFRRTSLPSFGDTTPASVVCSQRPPTRGRGHRGVDVPVPEPELSVETDGAPRFPGTPRVPWPCSPTPAGPCTPGHSGVSAWSPRLTRARTPADSFRGSIARPGHSLSTLRSEGHPSPRKTRFRLLAKLCRAGFVHPQGSDERFPSFESLPPFLSFPGAMSVDLNGGDALSNSRRYMDSNTI